MAKNSKINTRPEDEKLEGEKTVESNVPENRFQGTQQIVKPVEEAMDSKGESNAFVPKQVESKGSQLKQEQVAKVITGVGGVSPDSGMSSPSRAGLRTLAYSGNEGTILGNPSSTPVVGAPSRSDTRPGQKLDAVAKAIDYIASEQVLQHFDGSKPLQDNPGEVQGFLGHPENTSARVQKIAECVPGALLFARSCDEIARDEIVFARGQQIRESGIDYKFEPTVTYDTVTGSYKPFGIRRGNFIPKTMFLGYNSSGKLLAMQFDVDDISVSADAATVNASSSAFIRQMNRAEINRQNMEKVAGVETEKNWCPVVRAVKEPTQTVGYLDDDEVITASEVFMGYRFLNKSHSYIFNQAAKDGQTPYRSFREILQGNAVSHQSSTEYDVTAAAFTARDYLNGAPSLMIALYDSIAKYSKRGDIPTQPRSWRMHKQTADNNINQFMIDPDFASYVIGRDVFSTIDRGYDPLLPVCISDSWRVAHVYDFSELLNINTAKVFVLKLGAKGAALAGNYFNDIYDDIKSTTPTKNVAATLHAFSSGTMDSRDIYTAYGLSGIRGASKGKFIDCVGTKTGFNTYDDGLDAALDALYALDHAGKYADKKQITLLFKVKVADPGVDLVYAVCRYPNIISINESSVNVKLQINYNTTADYMSSDTSVDSVVVRTDELSNDIFTYKYQNRQNPYIVEVKNSLLFGLLEWAKNMGPKMVHASVSSGDRVSDLADTQGIIWFTVPIIHSTRKVSLWDLILCASVPFMQKVRTNSQYDTLNFIDSNGKYPFEELKSLSDVNPLACVNYAMTSILEPLKVLTMKASTAISWILPEKFWRIDHTDSAGDTISETFVLPFYFSEEEFKYGTSGDSITISKEDEGYVMNYPSTRAGARLAYLDDVYGMNERDIRLCLDRMTVAPSGYLVTADADEAGVYKYGLSNSGIPVLTYISTDPLSIGAVLTTPREIGLGMVAPCNYNSPCSAISRSNDRVTADSYAKLTDLISGGTSYSIRAWHVEGGQYKAIHAQSQLIVKRGGNFSQDWVERCDAIYAATAAATVPGHGARKAVKNIGMCVNFNDVMEVTSGAMVGESGLSAFKPFTDGKNANNSSLPTIITLQNALWPRLQVFPFALSPFDQTPEGRYDSGNITVDMTADPYDMMYIFGFCGFKASDYREDVFNRIYEKQTLGWLYTSDPFVTASPVLKDGGRS